MQWLRRLIRRNMNPIEEPHAHKWKQRLSIAYMLIAWNAFGMIAYAWYKGRGDWADYYGLKSEEEKLMPNNEYFARTIGRPGNTKLITMKGFTVVDSKDVDFSAETKETEENAEVVTATNTPGSVQTRVQIRRKLLMEEYERLKKEKEETLEV